MSCFCKQVCKKQSCLTFFCFMTFSWRFTSFLEKTLNSNQKSFIDPWRRTMPMLFPFFVVISGWESLTASRWDTSLLQVISLCKLVPIFQLSGLRQYRWNAGQIAQHSSLGDYSGVWTSDLSVIAPNLVFTAPCVPRKTVLWMFESIM